MSSVCCLPFFVIKTELKRTISELKKSQSVVQNLVKSPAYVKTDALSAPLYIHSVFLGYPIRVTEDISAFEIFLGVIRAKDLSGFIHLIQISSPYPLGGKS